MQGIRLSSRCVLACEPTFVTSYYFYVNFLLAWVCPFPVSGKGLLLDGTLQEIITQVSALEDFSEAETHELYRLLMSVANEIPSIFEVKALSEVRLDLKLCQPVDRNHYIRSTRCI